MRICAKWLWTVAACLLITILAAWNWQAAKANEEKVMYVYSDGCGYCQSFRPTFESVLAEYPQLAVERLDIHDDRDLAVALDLGAKATPTVFVVKGEQVVDKLEGEVPAGVLRNFLQKNLDIPLSGRNVDRYNIP